MGQLPEIQTDIVKRIIAFIEAGCLMYICATYQIFEKIIFEKVSLTLLILNKVPTQRKSAELTILDAGGKHCLGEFYSYGSIH